MTHRQSNTAVFVQIRTVLEELSYTIEMRTVKRFTLWSEVSQLGSLIDSAMDSAFEVVEKEAHEPARNPSCAGATHLTVLEVSRTPHVILLCYGTRHQYHRKRAKETPRAE